MNCKCRIFKNDDIVALNNLIAELGYNVDQKELEKNIHEIQMRGGAIFTAEVGNEVVGSVCAIIDVRLAEGVYAEIVSLVVSSNHRGKGFGKELVHAAECWAKNHVKKIRVRANVTRTAAHSFYDALGFKEDKEQKVFIKYM
ncbi:GNAT family N-acetyltransferase [Desulfopila aestuarii]|uniref:Ribosomal protein S18 acetylase RimI n=1 Tax=Desulfopila aestuarii DSM 18488 TaxID=1121416 RepID=A0A1M7YE02_9BACT|nr:GNAT family N-acetyltransferase [Desulfopila aestuarii]SHO50833.1 Ribosomal protein S18 acetylase RimI [Desulfopila aestuarii DSM 18488]